ncbi:MAG: hypothetical protein LBE82_13500 [Chitinophagaceae bacterium]|nr:hypothetical protein [Chitinophagaceae bacterium]
MHFQIPTQAAASVCPACVKALVVGSGLLRSFSQMLSKAKYMANCQK